jgi:hypothetical protein
MIVRRSDSWTKTADEIIARVRRGRVALEASSKPTNQN